jgi:hypothetical protein
MTNPLMTFKSHIEGRNADVAIYPDRIEWQRNSFIPGRRDSSMLLIRQVQAVTTHKGGLTYTTVRVAAGASITEFRVTKAQASEVKELIMRLALGST